MKKDYVGKNIPKLGFGFMRLPTLPGGTDKDIDIEQVKKMVDLYMERGFSYYDTAYVYHGGESEVAIREAVTKRFPREKFQVTTKMPLWNIQNMDDFEGIFKTQLERTGLEYFDFYFLHGIGKDRLEMIDKVGGWDFLKKIKDRGQAKHVGFSFHSPADCLNEILDKHSDDVDLVQLQINYMDWDSEDVQSRLCYEACMNHDVPVTIMEPVRGGSLATLSPEIQKIFKDADPDASLASWALRFCASLDGLITILSGMSNLEQVDDNTKTMLGLKPLTDSDRAVIAKVVDALNAIPLVPCTACRYCVDDCPQQINIPGIIENLNDYIKYQSITNVKRRYGMVVGRGGKASDCVGCKNCEDHCPQNIKITEQLEEAVKLFED